MKRTLLEDAEICLVIKSDRFAILIRLVPDNAVKIGFQMEIVGMCPTCALPLLDDTEPD
jgi:hypothetical protein